MTPIMKVGLYQNIVHRSFFGACPLASLGVGLLRGSLALRLAFGETAPSGRPPHPSRRAAAPRAAPPPPPPAHKTYTNSDSAFGITIIVLRPAC
jgi:hypothetical protein